LLSLFKKISLLLFNGLNFITPKSRKLATIITFPDFDDTAKNLVKDAAEKNIRIVILLSGVGKKITPQWASNIKCVKKYSFVGVWTFFRSKYVFFTHNHYPGAKVYSTQIIVNLWHGMPIKDIGKFDNNSIIPKATYTLASCDYFKNYFSKAFEMPLNAVINVAHPRLKSFINPDKNIINQFVKPDEKFGIWLPTYRHSILSGGRKDGDDELDIVGIENINYPDLDARLIIEKTIIFIKPHPMNLKQVSEKAKICKNIRFIDDGFLAERNTSLYELMALSDFLITDISSVYFDYKILNKKIIIAFCDKDKYTQSRCVGGRSYEKIISEPVIRTQTEFLKALNTNYVHDEDFEYMEYWQMENVNKNIFEQISSLK
jgi:CDP-glycerol glycerophosphotransferase (TagB/SpsB family)